MDWRDMLSSFFSRAAILELWSEGTSTPNLKVVSATRFYRVAYMLTARLGRIANGNR
jgi:hypothetical protein